MGLDLEVIQDGQEEVRDGQRNATYQLRLEVHLLSGLGRRGPLAVRRRPPGEPLRRGEVTLSDHLLDVAAGDVRAAPVAFVRVWLLVQRSSATSLWSPPVVSITADAGMTSPSGGTTTELAGFAVASLDAAIDGEELLLAMEDWEEATGTEREARVFSRFSAESSRRR